MSVETINIENGEPRVINNPSISFNEGNGTGLDIWAAPVLVFNAAVEKAYDGYRKINGLEVFTGENSLNCLGEWFPQETFDAFNKYLVGIKGTLSTTIGGRSTSLNVVLRQSLDLSDRIWPVKYITDATFPMKQLGNVDVNVFRENTKDIYVGFEWPAGSESAKKMIHFLQDEMNVNQLPFPEISGINKNDYSEKSYL